jgi:hypothetical protein
MNTIKSFSLLFCKNIKFDQIEAKINPNEIDFSKLKGNLLESRIAMKYSYLKDVLKV